MSDGIGDVEKDNSGHFGDGGGGIHGDGVHPKREKRLRNPLSVIQGPDSQQTSDARPAPGVGVASGP